MVTAANRGPGEDIRPRSPTAAASYGACVHRLAQHAPPAGGQVSHSLYPDQAGLEKPVKKKNQPSGFFWVFVFFGFFGFFYGESF